MSLFTVSNGLSTDDIINEVLWFHGRGKKSIIVLRRVLEIAGHFEKNEIDRFRDALEKKFHDKKRRSGILSGSAGTKYKGNCEIQRSPEVQWS